MVGKSSGGKQHGDFCKKRKMKTPYADRVKGYRFMS
jgi:hypothetical protein